MEEYDKLVDSVTKLEGLDQAQKEAILTSAKALNTEVGIRGADLKKIKSENQSLKDQNTSYKEFSEAMAKYNMSAEDIKKAADLAGIQQTYEDKERELKNILAERDNETKELKTQLWKFKQEQQLAPKIEDSIKNFVDAEGKPVELKPFFAKQVKDELYKGIKDGEDEVIVNDRINKALIKAKAEQDSFMEENGFVVSNDHTHKVREKTPAGSGPKVALTESVQLAQKIMEEGQGSSDATATAIAALRRIK